MHRTIVHYYYLYISIMAKKLSANIDYFEGYQLLGLVSQLKDYSLAYFLNQKLEIDLKKYEDLDYNDSEGQNHSFSWYFYEDEQQSAKIFLISNSSITGKLIPGNKELDYFLFLKDFTSDQYANLILSKSREIKNVIAVFKFDLNNIKNADILIENIELHEIKHILRPKSQIKKNTKIV